MYIIVKRGYALLRSMCHVVDNSAKTNQLDQYRTFHPVSWRYSTLYTVATVADGIKKVTHYLPAKVNSSTSETDVCITE